MVPRVSFINTVILFFWTWYVLIRFDGLQYQINLRGGIIFSYRIRCPALFWNKPFSCRQWVWRSTVNIRDCGLFFSKLGFAPYFCMWHVLDQDFMFPRPRFCTTENKVRAYFTGKGFVASLENVRCDLERWTLESKLGGCTVMNVNIYNDVLCTKLYTCKSQKKIVPSNVAHVPTVLVFFHRYFKRFRVVPCFWICVVKLAVWIQWPRLRILGCVAMHIFTFWQKFA